MGHCIYHNRLCFTAVNLFTLPVRSKVVLPCCNSPRGAEMFFRREKFLGPDGFDYHIFAEICGRFCNEATCPAYRPGKRPIEDISLSEWRKCPGSCITCPNHLGHAPERELSSNELERYMAEIGRTYREIAFENESIGAPPPSLVIGAAGDLFYSENYRNILGTALPDYGIRRIKLLTSLQTWTPHNCERIHPENRPLIEEIVISVDSATPGLYETIRAGSRWDNLIRGYKCASMLFPDAVYKLSVTVSKANFIDALLLPERIPGLFPKVSCISYHAVADWTGQPDLQRLLLSPEEKAYIKEWCATNTGKCGITLEFLH